MAGNQKVMTQIFMLFHQFIVQTQPETTIPISTCRGQCLELLLKGLKILAGIIYQTSSVFENKRYLLNILTDSDFLFGLFMAPPCKPSGGSSSVKYGFHLPVLCFFWKVLQPTLLCTRLLWNLMAGSWGWTFLTEVT